jgi:hypothetical protein
MHTYIRWYTNILFSKKQIPVIYLVYTRITKAKSIYQVYTRYIPCLNFLGFPDVHNTLTSAESANRDPGRRRARGTIITTSLVWHNYDIWNKLCPFKLWHYKLWHYYYTKVWLGLLLHIVTKSRKTLTVTVTIMIPSQVITLMTVLFLPLWHFIYIAIMTFHIYYDTYGYYDTIMPIIAFRTIITLTSGTLRYMISYMMS